MKKVLCLLLVLLLIASTAFSESIIEYVSSNGLKPTTSENKDGVIYCNYFKKSDDDVLEWSDEDYSYTVTDNVVLPVVYVNMLQMSDWELCNFAINK